MPRWGNVLPSPGQSFAPAGAITCSLRVISELVFRFDWRCNVFAFPPGFVADLLFCYRFVSARRFSGFCFVAFYSRQAFQRILFCCVLFPPGVSADLQSAVKKCSTALLGICNPHYLYVERIANPQNK